jgi:diguanylate cyclase (GGDEF)-like protein
MPKQELFIQNKFDRITRTEGLPSHQIHSIVFQKRRLWMATPNGLAIYDGENVRVMSQTSGLLVHGIRSVNKGFNRVLVCSDRGLDMVDDMSLNTVASIDTAVHGFGLCQSAIEVSNSHILLACAKGLVEWNIDDDSLTPVPNCLSQETIVQMIQGQNGDIIIHAVKSGLWHYHSGSFTPINPEGIYAISDITSIAYSQQTYWIATKNTIVAVPESDISRSNVYHLESNVNNIEHIFALPEGRFLVAANNSLMEMHVKQQVFVNDIVLQDSININDFCIDELNNYWIATDFAGLLKLPAINQFIRTFKSGRSNSVLSITQSYDNSHLLVGGTDKSYIIDLEAPYSNERLPVFDGNATWDLQQDDKRYYWGATAEGLIQFDKLIGESKVYTDKSLSHCRCLSFLDDRRILVGSVAGLFIFDRQEQLFHALLEADGKSIGYIYSISKLQKDELLVCTLGRGFWLLDLESMHITPYRNSFDLFNVYDVDQNNLGDIVIAGDNRLILQTEKYQKCIYESESAVAAWSCKWYTDSQILLGTSEGLKLYDLNTERFIVVIDNVPSQQFWEFTTSRSLFINSQNSVWGGTNEALINVDIKKIIQEVSYPIVEIESLILDISDDSLASASDNHLEVGFRHHQIEIHLGCFWYWMEKSLSYQYRLLGLNTNWIKLDSNRLVLNTMPIGEYILEIKVTNTLTLSAIEHRLLTIKVNTDNLFVRAAYRLMKLIVELKYRLQSQKDMQELETNNRRMRQIIQDKTNQLSLANQSLQSANQTLTDLSHTDQLTKLFNRHAFNDMIQKEVKRAIRENHVISICMLDVDYFKPYNDEHGHIAGDACLQKVAGALQKRCHRVTDIVARYGGEEFIIALIGNDKSNAKAVIEKCIKDVEGLKIVHNGSTASKFVTISAGLATEIPQIQHADQQWEVFVRKLVATADKALYQAKQQGRNQLTVSDENS